LFPDFLVFGTALVGGAPVTLATYSNEFDDFKLPFRVREIGLSRSKAKDNKATERCQFAGCWRRIRHAEKTSPSQDPSIEQDSMAGQRLMPVLPLRFDKTHIICQIVKIERL
jgi:hypothetical protein